MSRFQWNTKDIREDRDASDSNLSTVSRSSPEVTHLGEWTTSRRELLCFYLYSIVRFSLFFCTFFPIFYRRPKGNNGLAGFRFGPSQIQNLLYFAGHDLSQPPFAKPCSSGSNCVLPFLGHVRNSSSFSHRPHLRYSSMGLYIILLWVVNSIILLTNGICFAIQAVMLLMIGAWADYGTWRCAGLESFQGGEWTPTAQKQAKYLDFFYYFVCRLLVCMAWHSRAITMARRNRFVSP